MEVRLKEYKKGKMIITCELIVCYLACHFAVNYLHFVFVENNRVCEKKEMLYQISLFYSNMILKSPIPKSFLLWNGAYRVVICNLSFTHGKHIAGLFSWNLHSAFWECYFLAIPRFFLLSRKYFALFGIRLIKLLFSVNNISPCFISFFLQTFAINS